MKVDDGSVLSVTKASPNVHLDWSLDGTSGPFVVKRSLSFTFSSALYLGPAQTTKTFDDPVLVNSTSYAYEAFRRTLTDTLYFYHADHLGTPIAMTNGTGSLVWRAEHTPFGGIYALTVGTVVNNLRFPGKYYDGETGLAQNYFRDYRHNTGRYWETDPAFARDGFPSRYVYVGSDPLHFYDSLGLYACTYHIRSHRMSCVPSTPTNPPYDSCDWVSGNNSPDNGNCGDCQNNPGRTNIPNQGPIPTGTYNVLHGRSNLSRGSSKASHGP